MSILDLPIITRTRRHHALEHATIKILNRRLPTRRFIGWSTPYGFYVCGSVSTQDVQVAVDEALLRLRRGERHLAIHPSCGTNLVVSSTLAGLFAFLIMLPGSKRSRRERLPLVLLVSTLATMIAQPLGMLAQAHLTTAADLGDTWTARVDNYFTGSSPVYRIQLGRSAGE